MKRTSKATTTAVPVSQAEVVVDTITEAIDMTLDNLDLDEPQATEQVLVTDAEIDELTPDVRPSVLPVLTPKDLAAMFSIDQKVVRRHLRNKFTQPVGHEHNGSWAFKLDDAVTKEVLAYFKSKYPAQAVAK